MTKTLTEQWREGTLPDGKYYIKLEPNFTERYDVGYSEGGDFVLYNIEDIEEVLAPVPNYDKVKEMSQKIERLEFDNEALEMAHNEGKEINSELEQYNKDLLKDHTRLVMECDRLLAENKQLVNKTDKLEKKLEITKKALERYSTTETYDWIDSQLVAKKAL